MVIDKRVLHVSNIYRNYQNLSPTQLLNAVHQQLKIKFKKIALGRDKTGAGSAAEAKELQDFFQSIKSYANAKEGEISLPESVDIQVIQQILKLAQGGNFGKHKIFRTEHSVAKIQGDIFEKQMQKVIAATLISASSTSGMDNKATKKAMSGISKQIGLGTAYVNTGSNLIDVDEIAKLMVEEIGQEAYQELMEEMKKARFAQVQGKIDFSGAMAKIDISADAAPYLQRIATLLSKASFSAKSYRTMTYDVEKKMRVKIQNLSRLHLGATDQRRIFTDILSTETGLPEDVSLSFAIWLQKTSNTAAREMAGRLRFIYELTGYGQKYINDAIEQTMREAGITHANYFVYNDPSTDNIEVRSTAAIISDLWDEIGNILDEKSVSLSRQFTYAKIK